MSDEPGKLRPPYPSDTCIGEGCGKALTDDVAVYLFSDLDTGKLAALCEECTAALELAKDFTSWRLVTL